MSTLALTTLAAAIAASVTLARRGQSIPIRNHGGR
jgi:hypothetical protein